jgi:hypothetical protein
VEAILKEMVDHYLIDKLVREYSHGCDRLDEVRMAAAYAKESFDDHGRFRSSGQQFAHDVLAYQVEAGVGMCSHHLGQSLVKLNGDEAGAETYFIATLQATGPDGQPVLTHLGGRFVDELVREDGAWKIRNRICVRDWSSSAPILMDYLDGWNMVQGRRSGDDPSFKVLGVTHSGVPAAK